MVQTGFYPIIISLAKAAFTTCGVIYDVLRSEIETLNPPLLSWKGRDWFIWSAAEKSNLTLNQSFLLLTVFLCLI